VTNNHTGCDTMSHKTVILFGLLMEYVTIDELLQQADEPNEIQRLKAKKDELKARIDTLTL